MSDTLPPRQGSGEQPSFDDDPLAELARIVAGDADAAQPAEPQTEPVSAPEAADAAEVAFDLEAEMEQALLEDGLAPAVDVEQAETSSPTVQETDSFEDDLISALQNEVEADEPVAMEGDIDVNEAGDFEDALANELLADEHGASEMAPEAEQAEDAVLAEEIHAAAIEADTPEAGEHVPVFEPDAIVDPNPQELTGQIVGDAEPLVDEPILDQDGFSVHETHEVQAEAVGSEGAYADLSLEAEFGEAFEAELGQQPADPDGGWHRDDMQVSNDEFAHAVAQHQPLETQSAHEVDPLIYQQENELQPTDQDFSYAEPEPNKSNSMRIAFAALAFAVIAGGAVAGYGLFGGSNGTGEPVVIKADNSPIKVKPDEPGGQQIANEENASYGKVDGKDETVDQAELVSKTEEPAVVAPTQGAQSTAGAPKANDRLSSEEAQTNTNASGRAGNVRPRVVKTVRVRADGSIVANQTAAPIATPQLASIDGAKSSGKTAVPAASPVPKPQVAAPTTPAPASRPEPAPVVVAEQTPAPAPVVQESEWVVQVSSVKSEEQANATFRNLQQRFAALADRQMAVQRANVNGNTFYRVRVQTASKSDASSLCTNLKAAGGSCFITR